MQMIIFLLLILFVLFIISLFSSEKFSPIPYFPTNKKDIPAIIKALKLRNDQIIFDLGAGNGIVIFEAAKKAINLNTQFVAIDINPVLILIMHLRRLLHPNRKNIKIIWNDMFKINLDVIAKLSLNSDSEALPKLKQSNEKRLLRFARNDITIYLYISPWLLEKTVSKIKKNINKFSLVSYFYPIKSLKKREKIIKGRNNIYIY